MGKVDDQRAMREARYAARQQTASGAARVSPPATTVDSPRVSGAARQRATPAPAAASGELCGHRGMGNKSCTREKDHQTNGTKNHRYS